MGSKVGSIIISPGVVVGITGEIVGRSIGAGPTVTPPGRGLGDGKIGTKSWGATGVMTITLCNLKIVILEILYLID